MLSRRVASAVVALSLAARAMSSSSSSAAIAAAVPRDVVAKPRTVVKQFESVAQMDGEGAAVRRSIGRPELKSLDPFLMLDEFNVKAPGGFPPHPHRGQSTVTYMISGKFEHEDFKGHKGTIGPGDLQWMTAGKGICHSEVPVGDEAGRGLQLWINLPAKDKLCEPDYQELLAKDVPKVALGNVTATVIAGTAFGVTSPVRTAYVPVYYFDFKAAPGAVLTQAIPKGWNAFAYTIEGGGVFGATATPAAAATAASATAAVAADGAVTTGGAGTAAAAAEDTTPTVTGGTEVDAHHTIVLSNTGDEDGVVVQAGPKGCHFVIIAGKPVGEPVVQYGPFVLNTREQVMAAVADYQMGRNGFEGAVKFSEEWDDRHGR